MEYRDLCEHYYSTLTYNYALEDAYNSLRLDLQRSDRIYNDFQSFGYKSVIELSAKFITYLELFVAMRWCLRELFGSKINNCNGQLNDQELRNTFENLETQLPIIDGIWWSLRNEIHHSKLPKIRPVIASRLGSNEEFKGHMVPTPKKYEKWVNEKTVQEYFFGEKRPTFIEALDQHHKSINSIHNICLHLLIEKSKNLFGKGIEFSI